MKSFLLAVSSEEFSGSAIIWRTTRVNELLLKIATKLVYNLSSV